MSKSRLAAVIFYQKSKTVFLVTRIYILTQIIPLCGKGQTPSGPGTPGNPDSPAVPIDWHLNILFLITGILFFVLVIRKKYSRKNA